MTTKQKNETKLERTSDRELTMTRVFNAPPHLVWDAWTKPELVKRWWSPKSKGVEIKSIEGDVRVGGSYRIVFGPCDSLKESGETRGMPERMAFNGKYRALVAHKRIVHTEVFEPTAEGGDDASGSVITVTFEERPGGKTFVTQRQQYASKEILEIVIATGMESGMRESIDQLDELVAITQ